MADAPENSLNPRAPEYIPITTPPLPPPPPPPPQPPHPTHLLLRRRGQSLPVMLPTHAASPALRPPLPPLLPLPRPLRRPLPLPPLLPLPTVDSWRSTVMMKNIPSHFNRKKLIKFLDNYCSLENKKARDLNEENPHVFAYDFLYLPTNSKATTNPGYGFVNFTDHRTLPKFFKHFNERAIKYPNSARFVRMDIANIQGRIALVNRYENTTFVSKSEECLPVVFNPARNGSGETVQVITVGKFQAVPDIPID
ncbi:hypothetical protein EJD97_022772 [Solanum chilense]|uniref:Mei2-like C-terminal RNA recognition motif domain-containing protein n=1 Tax=Solanum chilense TaxID=4083 RepID=A0A6N2AT87_SOLCI|nr:hypothetical protein EJD97_022772 [Solanum chilense]